MFVCISHGAPFSRCVSSHLSIDIFLYVIERCPRSEAMWPSCWPARPVVDITKPLWETQGHKTS